MNKFDEYEDLIRDLRRHSLQPYTHDLQFALIKAADTMEEFIRQFVITLNDGYVPPSKPATPADVAALIDAGPRNGESPKEFARRAVGKTLCRKVNESELRAASRDVLKWLDSPEVKDTFRQGGSLSISHPHLAIKISKEFSVWADSVLKLFRMAVNGK